MTEWGVYLRVRFSLVGWRGALWESMSSSRSEISDENIQCLYYIGKSSLIKNTQPEQIVTIELRAAAPPVLVLTVGGAVHHLWDTHKELAIIPEDRHGQFAPALLHQVLRLQQGQILRRHSINLQRKLCQTALKVKKINKDSLGSLCYTRLVKCMV